MDRYVLLAVWNYKEDQCQNEEFAELTAIKCIDEHLRKSCCTSTSSRLTTLPACSITGVPTPQKWFFAIQTIRGFSQFCNTEWEEISSSAQVTDCEESIPTLIQEYLNNANACEEEDNDMKDCPSLSELFEEAAESLHRLADKLPPPGKVLLDLILLAPGSDIPRLKDWLPVVGAFKHLREWHSAEITITTKNGKCWQKMAEYLGATIVNPEKLANAIDPLVLWRGNIRIQGRKFASEVKFPGFCLRARIQNSWCHLKSFCSTTSSRASNTREVFHYYKPVLEFVQLVALSDLPLSLLSGIEFEFSLLHNDPQSKSKLLLNQLSSLQGKVGALFNLSCTVSSTSIPPANQYSTRKWKEYMAKKPKNINVPEIELKGEISGYYLLVQNDGQGSCKAILIHSASQINGAAAVAIVNGMLEKADNKEGCQRCWLELSSIVNILNDFKETKGILTQSSFFPERTEMAESTVLLCSPEQHAGFSGQKGAGCVEQQWPPRCLTAPLPDSSVKSRRRERAQQHEGTGRNECAQADCSSGRSVTAQWGNGAVSTTSVILPSCLEPLSAAFLLCRRWSDFSPSLRVPPLADGSWSELEQSVRIRTFYGGCDAEELLWTIPYLTGEQFVNREKKLAQIQTFALREFLKRKQINEKDSSIAVNELKALLTLVREQYFRQFGSAILSTNSGNECQNQQEAVKHNENKTSNLSPSQWPERSVLQNYENLEQIRQKSRAGSILTSSSETLLGLKGSQRPLPIQLDAKELLKFFTPEGFPIAELQPLAIQSSENKFPLTPEMTIQKLKGLPFEKATECHYHGVEYCLDHSRALEKDIGLGKLQSRLIRYETNTTCSREHCPVVYGLSPLPSPAVLSEPGSAPDGEILQSTQKYIDGHGQKPRSRRVDCLNSSKRLAKTKSVEFLESQNSPGTSQKAALQGDSQRLAAATSASSKQSSKQVQSPVTKPGHQSVVREKSRNERTQKHKRKLKEVVAKTLEDNGISKNHKSFVSCSQRLFKISLFYLKDLKTSRGLHEEMKKAAKNNVQQVIDWVLEKADKK